MLKPAKGDVAVGSVTIVTNPPAGPGTGAALYGSFVGEVSVIHL